MAINYDYLGVKAYKRIANLEKAGVTTEALLQLRSNIETFQAKHGITGGGKYGTYIKKSYTPQQKSQMVAILNNFLDQTGSSISAIKKSYKDFERGLEKLGKKYKVPATAQKMAERLDKRDAIVEEARIRYQLPSEYIQQAYQAQQEYGWDTATTEAFLKHMTDRAESGANIEDIWDAALDDLVNSWKNKGEGEWEMPWQ